MRPGAGQRTAALLLICLAGGLVGCRGGGADRRVEGRVLREGRGVPSVKVEVYLRAGRFRDSTPFAVGYTDEEGRYELRLPKGRYYLSGRGEMEGRRLYGEFPGNPLDLSGTGDRRGADIPLEEALAGMEYRGPADSGVEGTVSRDGRPAAGAFIYVYQDARQGLKGPGYLAAEPVGPDGSYRVRLHPGRYWITARGKAGSEKTGFVSGGDLTAEHPLNPVGVGPGGFSPLGDLPLHPADPAKLARAAEERLRPVAATGLAGRVLGKDGQPAPGLYVLVYRHPQMIGRPLAVAVSGPDGRFRLALPGGGLYYLGARQNRSGPRTPGEMAGGYEATPDHAVRAEEGRWLEDLAVRVEEVW